MDTCFFLRKTKLSALSCEKIDCHLPGGLKKFSHTNLGVCEKGCEVKRLMSALHVPSGKLT